MISLLAQTQTDPRVAWLPVVLMIIIGIGFAAGNIILSTIIGPKNAGPGKASTYESGMVPIGDTRRRFNVRFYIVAMIFLIFDVEIVFFYPWATLFPETAASAIPSRIGPGILLIELVIFVAILLVAYFYAWGKGVFKWD